MLILKAISLGPLHGYGILLRIQQTRTRSHFGHPRHWMVVCIGLVASTLFAENPFVGKWKIDAATSHMTGTTDSVTAERPNQWKFQDGSASWSVKADGSDQPAPFGSTVAMQAVDASTWQFTNKSNGKVIGHETWVLSADGKSMTRTFTSPGPSGEPVSGVASMKRIAGTRGF
jgi:hypothetical protein